VIGHLEEYASVQDRLTQLVTDADANRLVPGCPGWHVRDVVAHLVGLCGDWVEGRFDGYASDEWTAIHLGRFAGWTVEAMFDAWGRSVARFEELVDSPFGATPARWAFGDAVIHEADIRGALGAGRVPTEAVALGLRSSLARWEEVLERANVPAVRIVTSDELWHVGPPDDPDPAEVEVQSYEVFRALAGRRSRDQVVEWRWSRDASPIVEAGLPYPFRWASHRIVD
jgi:uncharacterized protein (TIGR03083 family)